MLADRLREQGMRVFGPSQAAARIEQYTPQAAADGILDAVRELVARVPPRELPQVKVG